MAVALKGSNLLLAVPMILNQAETKGGPHRDNLSVVAVRWEDAYVEEADVDRLQAGADARFLIHGEVLGQAARVVEIDTTRTLRLAHPMLDSRYGGPILTQANEKTSQPVKALYRVRLALDAPLTPAREARGVVVIEGARHSLLLGWCERSQRHGKSPSTDTTGRARRSVWKPLSRWSSSAERMVGLTGRPTSRSTRSQAS